MAGKMPAMKNTPITKEQWFSADREPPLDFSSPIEAFGYKYYRRFVWLLASLFPNLAAKLVLKSLYGARRFPRPDRERELLKQAESFSLDFEDGELACWRFSPLANVDDPKTAVLIHGWEGRAAQLGSLVEPLQRKGYQVYLMDLPAHGDSDGTRNNPMKSARALLRLGKKLKHIDLLVAHSFGALASMQAMLQGLSVGRFIGLAAVVNYRAVMRDVRLMFNLPASAKAAYDLHVSDEIGVPWQQLELVSKASQISTPCVYMHDPQDLDQPYWGAVDMVAALPTAELVTVPDVGHRKIMWSEQVIQYLKDHV